MKDNTPDDEFWNIADSFIDLANNHSMTMDKGKISAAFLYAASRFNSFIAAINADDREGFENSIEGTVDYYVEQYRSMVRENLNDYLDNYQEYIVKNK